MAGCHAGYAVSAEFIVSSQDPLDPKLSLMLPAFVRALEAAFMRTTFTVAGDTGRHRIVEAHVYRVAPSLTSIRSALGMSSPWVGGGARAKKRTSQRGRKRTTR